MKDLVSTRVVFICGSVVFCFVCLSVCLAGWVSGLVGWFVGWLICLVCFFLVFFRFVEFVLLVGWMVGCWVVWFSGGLVICSSFGCLFGW